ncbi:hypothetical protein IIC38_12025 [candidate division KSB1 bacterium]|nr:hypothetical protein [candidate division KSB1 bacterium]
MFILLTCLNTFTNKSALFRIQDNADNTKQVAFDVSKISEATTRTFTWPDVDGIVLVGKLPPPTGGVVAFFDAFGFPTAARLLHWDDNNERLGVGTGHTRNAVACR